VEHISALLLTLYLGPPNNSVLEPPLMLIVRGHFQTILKKLASLDIRSWTPSPTPPLSVMAKVADSHTWTLKTVADMHVGHSCSQRVSFAPTSCVAMQAQGLLKRMVQSSC